MSNEFKARAVLDGEKIPEPTADRRLQKRFAIVSSGKSINICIEKIILNKKKTTLVNFLKVQLCTFKIDFYKYVGEKAEFVCCRFGQWRLQSPETVSFENGCQRGYNLKT